MYAYTKMDIVDQSQIQQVTIPEANGPLFMSAFTSEKGPEGWRVVDQTKFEKLYGSVLPRHGQALLQTKRSIDNGARMLSCRVVAPDATLANVVIVAKVKKITAQKRNSEGDLLYKTAGDVETTAASGNTPIMIDVANIKYEAVGISGATSISTVNTGAAALLKTAADGEGYKHYPLFMIADNGRGLSNKKIRISPAYELSKNLGFLKYQLDIIDGTSVMETVFFSFDPERIESMENQSMDSIVRKYCIQVQGEFYDQDANSFFNEVKAISKLSYAKADVFDLLFGKTSGSIGAGTALQEISIDNAGINLSNISGISLTAGTKGTTECIPANAAVYETALTNAFSGADDPSIFDLDLYKVAAVIDANYPNGTKAAIESLANFREDFFFFRDLTTSVSTAAGIKTAHAARSTSRYAATYCMVYDIIDPYSLKQMTVTAGYTLSKILVDHFKNGAHRPVAGLLYGMVIDDAIEGTLKFRPIKTPSVDQKKEFDDLRINYAEYSNNRLVIASEYTAQSTYSQLSFINNVLAIQEVIRDVRDNCPKSRYNWLDGDAFTTYQKDVERILDGHRHKFKELAFQYIQDDAMVQNKIFRAAITVDPRDFIQAEWFTLYVI